MVFICIPNDRIAFMAKKPTNSTSKMTVIDAQSAILSSARSRFWAFRFMLFADGTAMILIALHFFKLLLRYSVGVEEVAPTYTNEAHELCPLNPFERAFDKFGLIAKARWTERHKSILAQFLIYITLFMPILPEVA